MNTHDNAWLFSPSPVFCESFAPILEASARASKRAMLIDQHNNPK
jgi:hypothetical protein